MDNIKNEGIIHEVHLDKDELCLRLDMDRLGLETNAVQPIVIVRLTGCTDIADILHTVQQARGKYLYFWAAEASGGGMSVVLEIDYGLSEIEVDCTCVTKTYSDYTMEDLHRKCQWLSAAYQSSQNERRASEREHYTLSTRLTKTINNEIERCEKKLGFFSKINPERAAAMQGQIEAYQRVLVRMSQSMKPNSEAV